MRRQTRRGSKITLVMNVRCPDTPGGGRYLRRPADSGRLTQTGKSAVTSCTVPTYAASVDSRGSPSFGMIGSHRPPQSRRLGPRAENRRAEGPTSRPAKGGALENGHPRKTSFSAQRASRFPGMSGPLGRKGNLRDGVPPGPRPLLGERTPLAGHTNQSTL